LFQWKIRMICGKLPVDGHLHLVVLLSYRSFILNLLRAWHAMDPQCTRIGGDHSRFYSAWPSHGSPFSGSPGSDGNPGSRATDDHTSVSVSAVQIPDNEGSERPFLPLSAQSFQSSSRRSSSSYGSPSRVHGPGPDLAVPSPGSCPAGSYQPRPAVQAQSAKMAGRATFAGVVLRSLQ